MTLKNFIVQKIIESLQESNLLYRSGDLIRKAEDAYTMSGMRGTGHFGTGFYFFGSKEMAEKYDKREVSSVDSSKYNLIRISPIMPSDGFLLHDTLKAINNFRYQTKIEASAYDIVETFELPYFEYKNRVNFMDFDKWFVKNEQIVSFLLGKINVGDVNPYNNDTNLTIEILEICKSVQLKNVAKINEQLNRIIDDLLNCLKKLKVSTNSVTKQSLIDEVKSYQLKVNENDKSSVGKDTLGTKLLKMFGIEGINVSGVKGLDNSDYGSVIFDIKN